MREAAVTVLAGFWQCLLAELGQMLVLPVLAVGLGMGCSIPETEDFDEAHFGAPQWELVRETGLDFPESARGLRFFCDNRCAFDQSYAARIALPPDAEAAIAAQLEKMSVSEQVPHYSGDGPDRAAEWWPPEESPRRLERWFAWAGGGLVRAFLRDEEEGTVLYLYWFTM